MVSPVLPSQADGTWTVAEPPQPVRARRAKQPTDVGGHTLCVKEGFRLPAGSSKEAVSCIPLVFTCLWCHVSNVTVTTCSQLRGASKVAVQENGKVPSCIPFIGFSLLCCCLVEQWRLCTSSLHSWRSVLLPEVDVVGFLLILQEACFSSCTLHCRSPRLRTMFCQAL